ncbi:MAG: ABC transporter permease [Trueperaceae bacterium]|nr:ABC transporter permease [Trueperaceae bacterium]MCO5172632.1 ABC transporter permease [Trueperaceae bacterium]
MAPDTDTPRNLESIGSADEHLDQPARKGRAWKRFRRNPLAVVGLIMVAGFVLIATLAPVLTELPRSCLRDLELTAANQHDYRNPVKPVFWKAIFAPPKSCFTIARVSFSTQPADAATTKTVLGTTSGGYDIFYGLVWGTRTAFKVGLIVVGIAFAIGIIIGSLSGYIGGVFDNLVMRFTDIVISLPSLVVALVVVMVLGKSIENIMLAIAVTAWPSYARLMRGEVLRIKEEEYVAGARAIGRRPLGIIGRHVLPNAIGPIVIVASLDIGSIVLTAAALSFLGLGAEIGYADWGQMISFARDWILGPPGKPFYFWYVSFWPGLIILLFVLAWNLLGDAFRDVLDPQAK